MTPRTRSVEQFLEADEIASEKGVIGWVSQGSAATEDDAVAIARRDSYTSGAETMPMKATPVLLREESEVEANIHGHEFPLWVECTKRARHPVPYWRVEVTA